MGKNWAIAIGINQYDNLQPLSYAKRDAAAMRDYFLNEAGFEQVYYFAEDAPNIEQTYGPPFQPLPTFAKLDRFLDVRFEQPFLHPGDNFWFFFAGHGKRHRDRDYLMPSDVNPRNIEGTAIPLHYVTERLRRCGADNVILLLDACRNEGDRDGEGIGIETQQGVVTLFACSPNERSYEIDELQQGAFTHALLQGLRIQGEGNCATVERLYQHLRYQVPELNRRYQKPRQTPYTIAEPATKLHLILLPKQATLADVTILKNDALEAEAEQDWELAEQLWTRVLIVLPGDQQAIKAIKRVAIRSATASSRVTPAEPVPASSRSTSDPTKTSSPVIAAPPKPAPAIPTFEFDIIKVNAQGQQISKQRGQAQYFTEDLGSGVILEMVSIPGGEFQMGSPDREGGNDERPQHSVIVKPFLMGKYLATQVQWKAVAGLPKVNRDLEPDPAYFKGGSRPVEQISWYEAVEFCARLSKQTGHEYRLPSEAEWEYACRAGTMTPFCFGETIVTNLANYNGNYLYASEPKGKYREHTTEVGSFSPNAFGLYDMHGNVREWCLDHWHDNYEEAPSDGSAWVTGGNSDLRLLRGGLWNFNPGYCRSANRSRNTLDSSYYYIGFRVVCGSA
ncbi:SUMF1/EgtB/PvdO family nonheme iron enzyme [Trichocoleus sp. FACHB-591]|uniref:SUMF1/EgtB/PvdO family nonheme iron enzyme n=1 Tax=Trichocoleus sp. FACHB-591 TaxID=2692872 RepID=UPI001681CDF5|nr:SUMF1/EgtB/PvdO family nonheme iron enzyme [Trichocoleus sp. FACHB-591]MBD2095112.1 SUMF1/EgtB/PvdO family nonheme iron enzyme [Trichocoleus sp. FACHB-591]